MRKLEGISILVVDDEVDLREIVKEDLEFRGATVTEASNGTIALEIVKKAKIDVVVSDVRMPGGDGITLLKSLKSEFPKLPIVFLVTGYADITTDSVKALGATELFSKPFDIEKIVAEIIKALQVS